MGRSDGDNTKSLCAEGERDGLWASGSSLFARLGRSQSRSRCYPDPSIFMPSFAHYASHLRRSGTEVLIDAGANTGQFVRAMRAVGYKGLVISFEPLSDAHTDLVRRANGDAKWEIAERCALGAATGQADINIAANSFSSSLRPMLDAHLQVAPESAYVGVEATPIVALGDYLARRFPNGIPSFALKIDTQGFEAEVLEGLGSWSDRCSSVMLEMPLNALYGGAATLPELFARLNKMGFRCVDMTPGHRDRKTGDAIKPDEFFLYTSIPPFLSGAALTYQKEVINSWIEAGFTPVSLNGPSEVDHVRAMHLGIEVKPLKTDGKPLIGEMLAEIVSRGGRAAAIVNADCKAIEIPHLAQAISSRIDGSLFFAQRIETLNGSPLFDQYCYGFDGFFFGPSCARKIEDFKYRMGEFWWDYWLPIRLLANGAKISKLRQPILLHEFHEARWSDKQWLRYAELFWKEFRNWKIADLPTEITDRFFREEIGAEAGYISQLIFQWLHKKADARVPSLLPSDYHEAEALFRLNALIRPHPALQAGMSDAVPEARDAVTEARDAVVVCDTAALDAMRASTSWRVTAPLRAIGRIVKRERRRRDSSFAG
jgi:FkbM family methyltransferase